MMGHLRHYGDVARLSLIKVNLLQLYAGCNEQGLEAITHNTLIPN